MRGEAAKVAKNMLIIMAISDGLRRFSVRYGFTTAQPVLDQVVSLYVPKSTSDQRYLKRIDAKSWARAKLGSAGVIAFDPRTNYPDMNNYLFFNI